MSKLIKLREAAEMIGVHPNTLRVNNWIPCYRIGNRRERTYRLEDVETYLAKRYQEADPDEGSNG